MSKTKFSTYNDGIVSVYREKPRRTDFNAKKNVSALDDMELIVNLNYEESSRREEDVSFAEQMGFSLSLKVRTRLYLPVDKTCKAVIDGYLYDISYVDKDRKKGEMWLYLEGIRRLTNDT